MGSKACPDCGSVPVSFGQKIETIEAELEELDKTKKDNKVDKRVVFGMLLHMQNKKNWHQGRKAHLYREIFGVWPRNINDIAPIPPCGEQLNMIKYAIIKSAKKYKKALDKLT
jgi:hypothetical protein